MWYYEGREFREEDATGYVGFVYLIENTITGKSYIGKKSFTRIKVTQKDKKKKRNKVSSDWMEYTGSNTTLNEDSAMGHLLKKTILRLCKNKSEMSYYEAKEQFTRDVLLSDDYYNDWIMVRVRRSHIKRNGDKDAVAKKKSTPKGKTQDRKQ